MTDTTNCTCSSCERECERLPGWFAPGEAVRAIEAGLAPRLALVQQGDVYALAPAPVGKEGQEIEYQQGRCTFFTQWRRCEIHKSGFKPIECVTGFGCHRGPRPVHPDLMEMFAMWRSDAGRAAVRLWQTRIQEAAA